MSIDLECPASADFLFQNHHDQEDRMVIYQSKGTIPHRQPTMATSATPAVGNLLALFESRITRNVESIPSIVSQATTPLVASERPMLRRRSLMDLPAPPLDDSLMYSAIRKGSPAVTKAKRSVPATELHLDCSIAAKASSSIFRNTTPVKARLSSTQYTPIFGEHEEEEFSLSVCSSSVRDKIRLFETRGLNALSPLHTRSQSWANDSNGSISRRSGGVGQRCWWYEHLWASSETSVAGRLSEQTPPVAKTTKAFPRQMRRSSIGPGILPPRGLLLPQTVEEDADTTSHHLLERPTAPDVVASVTAMSKEQSEERNKSISSGKATRRASTGGVDVHSGHVPSRLKKRDKSHRKKKKRGASYKIPAGYVIHCVDRPPSPLADPVFFSSKEELVVLPKEVCRETCTGTVSTNTVMPGDLTATAQHQPPPTLGTSPPKGTISMIRPIPRPKLTDSVLLASTSPPKTSTPPPNPTKSARRFSANHACLSLHQESGKTDTAVGIDQAPRPPLRRHASTGSSVLIPPNQQVWKVSKTHAVQVDMSYIQATASTGPAPPTPPRRSRVLRRHSTGSICSGSSDSASENFWQSYEAPEQEATPRARTRFEQRRTVRFDQNVTVWVFAKDPKPEFDLQLPQSFVTTARKESLDQAPRVPTRRLRGWSLDSSDEEDEPTIKPESSTHRSRGGDEPPHFPCRYPDGHLTPSDRPTVRFGSPTIWEYEDIPSPLTMSGRFGEHRQLRDSSPKFPIRRQMSDRDLHVLMEGSSHSCPESPTRLVRFADEDEVRYYEKDIPEVELPQVGILFCAPTLADQAPRVPARRRGSMDSTQSMNSYDSLRCSIRELRQQEQRRRQMLGAELRPLVSGISAGNSDSPDVAPIVFERTSGSKRPSLWRGNSFGSESTISLSVFENSTVSGGKNTTGKGTSGDVRGRGLNLVNELWIEKILELTRTDASAATRPIETPNVSSKDPLHQSAMLGRDVVLPSLGNLSGSNHSQVTIFEDGSVASNDLLHSKARPNHGPNDNPADNGKVYKREYQPSSSGVRDFRPSLVRGLSVRSDITDYSEILEPIGETEATLSQPPSEVFSAYGLRSGLRPSLVRGLSVRSDMSDYTDILEPIGETEATFSKPPPVGFSAHNLRPGTMRGNSFDSNGEFAKNVSKMADEKAQSAEELFSAFSVRPGTFRGNSFRADGFDASEECQDISAATPPEQSKCGTLEGAMLPQGSTRGHRNPVPFPNFVEPETVQPCRLQSEGANLATAKNVELEVWSILDSMENDDDIDLHEVRPKDDQVRQTIYQTFQKTQEKARRQQGLGSQPRVSVIKADRSVSGKKLRLRAKNGGRASVT